MHPPLRYRSPTRGPVGRFPINTWFDAEIMAKYVMRDLGYDDAFLSRRGADGGIDIRSSRALVQVKRWASKPGEPAMRDLIGARGDEVKDEMWLLSKLTRNHDRRKELWFFSESGYSRRALEYANRYSIRLFTYDADGEITPVNGIARDTLAHRLRQRDSRATRAKVSSFSTWLVENGFIARVNPDGSSVWSKTWSS
jgi:hypothetical protein